MRALLFASSGATESNRPAYRIALLPLLLLTLWSPQRAHAQYPAELAGRIVDRLTGDAIENVLVEVLGTERTTRTDGRGGFRLRGLAPGRFQVRLSHIGYSPAVREVELENGSESWLAEELAARPFELDEISVQVEAEAPPGAIRMSREEIESSGALTAADALDGRAGVVIIRRGPTGQQTVSLRGSAADQVLILLDGAPLNDPLTGAADLSTIAASQIESITVLKGSRSARFGPGAEAGVVLIETRVAAPPLSARAEAGSLGYRSGHAESGGRVGRYTWSGGGYARGADGRFTYQRPEALGGGEATRTNNDITELGGFLTTGGPLSGGRLRARLGYAEIERGLPGLSFVPTPNARQELARWRGQLNWERTSGRLGLSARLHGISQNVRFADPDPPLGLPYDTRTDSRVLGARLSGDLGLAGTLESVNAGVQVEDQRYSSTAFGPDAPDGRLDLGIFGGATAGVPGSGFAPRLLAALRLDRDGLSASWHLTHELTASATAGIIDFYARHASSYKPPTFGDQFFSEGVGVEPNPELRAERIPHDLSAGIVIAPPLGEEMELRLGLDGYIADVEDMIIWAPDSRFIWSPRNFDIKRRGIDAEATLSLPGRPLDFRASYSYARVTYDRPGGDDDQQVIYRPRHTGALAVDWRPASWDLRLDVRYIGVRYPVPAPVNALDPYWTLGLQLRRRFHLGSWSITPRLTVNRLTDNQDSLIFGYPEAGRTVRLEITAGVK